MTYGSGLDIIALSVNLGSHRILSDVSISFGRGGVTAVVGPNGSGKSTLLRCLFGALAPTSGRVVVDGDDVKALSRAEVARRIAVVSQDHPITFEFTVLDVVSLGRIPHRRSWEGLSQREHELIRTSLERTGTAHLADRRLATLSGGEKQRVMVARALVQESPYLLLDEPTNHLDIRYQLEVLHLLRSLEVTAIVALHDLNLVWHWCDRVVLMSDGQVTAVGSPEAVLSPERVRTAFKVDARLMTDDHDGSRLLRFSLPELA